MNEQTLKSSTKILVSVTFLAMIVTNALANILPINGQGTGAVSDAYTNLFAPAGLTFAIWGVIYLLLAGYTAYLIGLFQTGKTSVKFGLLTKTGIVFSISSIANTAWIFAWHYHQIGLSMILMLVILVSLIAINRMIRKEALTIKERLFIGLPFSVYFGWITVATIANATTLLVSLDWNGFGISEPIWTILILVIGMLIGASTMLVNRDFAYGLVLIWAYFGILIKHTSVEGFSGQYLAVIITVSVCITLFILAEGKILFTRKK